MKATRIQREYLEAISRFTSRPASYQDIAWVLGLSEEAVCMMAQRLNARGFVTLDTKAGRTGFSRVSLTESGKAALNA